MGGEFPVGFFPELALWTRRGSGFFHSGCGFPYPIVSIILMAFSINVPSADIFQFAWVKISKAGVTGGTWKMKAPFPVSKQ